MIVRAAAPPLPSSAPLFVWAAMAVVLAAIVLLAVPGPGPLDDPQPGDQRPGILLDPGEGPTAGQLALPGDPIGRRPVLVIFDRELPAAGALERFLAQAPERAATFVVVRDAPIAAGRVRQTRVVEDRAGLIAAALQMPQPKDGGPPVGYAVVDSSARVRYATLDPAYRQHGAELDTIARSIT